MDFNQNNAGLDALLARYQAFTQGNPNARFSPFHMPIEQFQRAPELTKEHLGDKALDTVAGVLSGEGEDGVVTLFTGNSPGSPERAAFLVDILSNFHTFYAWMKAYLDIRQNGFTVTYRPDIDEGTGTPLNTGSFLAIGPGFQSLAESPYAVADTAERALSLLMAKFANVHLISDDWDSERRQFTYDVEWTFARSHPDKPGEAVVPDDQQQLVVTGRWIKPGTRLAVKTHRKVPLDTAEGSEAMIAVKREIIDDLWANRERAGGDQ